MTINTDGSSRRIAPSEKIIQAILEQLEEQEAKITDELMSLGVEQPPTISWMDEETGPVEIEE